MSDESDVSPPEGWVIVTDGSREITFSNSQRGLELSVVAVYASTRTRQQEAEPSHWTIQLHQDWFGTATMGEKHMAAKAATRAEALSVAQTFMREFAPEYDTQASAQADPLKRSFVDPELGDDILTRRVCASVFTDAAGYSDDLLCDVLAEETNGQYRYLVHRDGHDIDVLGEDAPPTFDETRLASIYASFSVDQLGVERTTSDETPIAMTLHLGDDTVYRFIFGDGQETDVVVPRGVQVVSPCFEQTVANVLEAKWA